MNLIPWRRKRESEDTGPQPESSLAHFRHEMDTLLDRFMCDPWASDTSRLWTGLSMPRTDLSDEEHRITVSMDLPGVKPEEVKIGISNGLLTVRGEKRQEKQEKKKHYHLAERSYGGFQRTIRLPNAIDPEQVEATFADGVLNVSIAKRADAKPRRIKVRNA